MVPASRAAHHIEVTAESLQEDLSRLELQKRALERELAAVVAHLDTVQRALVALEVVMADSPEAAAATDGAAGAEKGRRRAAGRAQARRAPHPKGDTERTYGRLTEQILQYLAQNGDSDVRARDVAAALGRATDSGSINAIRSTLDRLVGSSRVRRTGRGLYRAGRP